MSQQVPIDSSARADEMEDGKTRAVLSDLAYQRLAIVNVVYYGDPTTGRWVLIDAGVMGTTGQILSAVEERFGKDSRPQAIVLTHGHFDHVGALPELAEKWDVPIYAHEAEHPYLDGRASYPAPDPTVGGGMMAAMASLYPRGPTDVRGWLKALPANREVPHMPGWRWVHAPGHTPGQVALWREPDRTLIAADAFITTAQESAYAVAFQRPELHGPPMYYTQDWDAARETVRRLAALEPELAITGHGRAMKGEQLRSALHKLAENFDEIAVPEHGRYVEHPARAGTDAAYPPPKG
jgi:glyoxylase-like metal-dependent hydrolase (beta-lactamase superfamily II)